MKSGFIIAVLAVLMMTALGEAAPPPDASVAAPDISAGTNNGLPSGFILSKESISPDGRYGVAVPVYAELGSGNPKDILFDIRERRVVAVIDATPGWDRALNYNEVLPARWSPDNSLLLWEVAGKWFPTALVVMKLEGGRLKWQVNLLKTVQQAILARTKKAAPQAYAAAKKANKGNGWAYPEGFTVDLKVVGPDPLGFPLQVVAGLTSNPKQIADFPDLDARMEGNLHSDAVFKVTDFGTCGGR